MSVTDVLQNRRKFLKLSALGAGGILALSGMLQSCTLKDHTIPPIDPPIGDGDPLDWNESAKEVVDLGISAAIPEGGEFIAALVNIFWPSSGSIWDQVKEQTEAEIHLQIEATVYSNVKNALGTSQPPTGLISRLTTYQTELKGKDPDSILEAWKDAKGAFQQEQGFFQDLANKDSDINYQVPLLPLFAQFANLYLGLLRDGVAKGLSWNMKQFDYDNNVTDLTDAITAFVSYAATTYNTGRGKIFNDTQYNQKNAEPFRTINAYDRQMTLTVLDYMDTWPYYDYKKYPNGAKNPDGTKIPLFTREIYSDPYGNLVKSSVNDTINLPAPATQFPTQITVWGGDRIDAVQLTYPAGGGPGGVTTTPRMGDKSGGSSNRPHGGTVNFLPDIPITSAYVSYDLFDVPINGGQWTLSDVAYINTIQFIQTAGNSVIEENFGGAVGKHQSGEIKYPKYALSSIYIHGSAEGHANTSSDCIVFGFLRQR